MNIANNEFVEFPKMPRLSRKMSLTEKIDGTNASIVITDEGEFLVGSRTRWITPEQDNYGFARWAYANKDELMALGVGRHYGEWWGAGIQRGYGQKEKHFSLFNVGRWVDTRPHAYFDWSPVMLGGAESPLFVVNGVVSPLKEKQEYAPACCRVVPILYEGMFDTVQIKRVLDALVCFGSVAIHNGGVVENNFPAEGIIVYHTAGNLSFKKTIEHDEIPKSAIKKM